MTHLIYGITSAITMMAFVLTSYGEQNGEDPGGGYIDPNG